MEDEEIAQKINFYHRKSKKGIGIVKLGVFFIVLIVLIYKFTSSPAKNTAMANKLNFAPEFG